MSLNEKLAAMLPPQAMPVYAYGGRLESYLSRRIARLEARAARIRASL